MTYEYSKKNFNSENCCNKQYYWCLKFKTIKITDLFIQSCKVDFIDLHQSAYKKSDRTIINTF